MSPRYNFLDVRTLGYSLAVLCVASVMLGPWVGVPFGAVVYVWAALSPRNVSTCRFCGEGTNPQATVCRACGRPVR